MEFIRKNFVTIMVVGATVVLAGVAIFTAMRLYNLRNNPVTPANPGKSEASDSPLGIRPKSGNWNLPESFVVTNSSDKSVDVVWHIDCWDENVCQDSKDTVTLAPGQSFEQGLGLVCSQWQLDLNWSGTATDANDVWDWAGVSEIGPDCDTNVGTDTATGSGALATDQPIASPAADATASPEAMTDNQNANASDYQITACTAFSFSVGGAAATNSPTVTSTPVSTAVATATPVSTATSAPQLPDAGVGLPTIIGIGAGAIMLILAVTLAI